jgi:hypothetical protein
MEGLRFYWRPHPGVQQLITHDRVEREQREDRIAAAETTMLRADMILETRAPRACVSCAAPCPPGVTHCTECRTTDTLIEAR